MYTQQAIERASKSGYMDGFEFKGSVDGRWLFTSIASVRLLSDADVLMDKEFFVCLGKHEGWDHHSYYEHLGNGYTKFWKQGEWLHHWHHLIDHLATGGSIEDYFKEILKD